MRDYQNDFNNDFNDDLTNFDTKKDIFFFLKNKKIMLIGGVLLIFIMTLLFFVFSKNKDEKYYITLEGADVILIYEDSLYAEPGYKGFNDKEEDLTSLVTVSSNVDTTRPGNYTVIYELNGVKVYRTVKVISKDIVTTTIELKGNDVIYLNVNDMYVEPGFIATDIIDGNITNKVIVSNNVDVKKAGEYKITYSVINSSGITTFAYRKVIVSSKETKINLSLSNSNQTSGPIYIKVNIIDDNFNYMILPNNTKVTSKTYSYKVTKNGTYKFTYYNKSGEKTEKSITISNIAVTPSNKFNLSLSSSSQTSGPIYIKVNIIDDNFNYMILPNNTKVTSKTYSYKVTKNGTYKFTYYNKSGEKTEKSITVNNIVLAANNKINLSLSTTSKTGGPININVNIIDDNFSYMILPNNTKVTSKTYSYKVTKNGTYKFIYYNIYGSKAEKTIIVSNLVEIPGVNVYTSDNIKSGNIHSVGFQIKLTSSASSIYYCLDSNNTCNPSIKYTDQLTFLSSTNKYLRYTSCNSNGICNTPSSYKINLNINLVNPEVSTSTSTRYGMKNPYQAAYYYQADSRWANYDIYINNSMAASGCGYNTYAMLLTGLTHDYSITPVTLIKKLKSYRSTYNIEFQLKSQNGALHDYIIHTHTYMKSYYNYDSANLWRNDVKKIYADAKKEKIVASLKMGHMIFANVPGHFIALVGINENEKIYVFDPARGTSLQDVDTLYDDTYYNYHNKCTTSGNCGMRVAYEVYPKGGISLDEWQQIK